MIQKQLYRIVEMILTKSKYYFAVVIKVRDFLREDLY